jgi:L-ascorbate metabolism protein UlaG (beta-lactamase superfamily)
MNEPRIGSDRHDFAVGVIGGPTAVIDYAGLRIVTDPTFDPPGDYGAYRKLTAPAVEAADLGPVDVVLLSHDDHADNLDTAGRRFATTVPALLTGPRAAGRLGGNARGLAPFETYSFADRGSSLVAHAVPAQHGPSDGVRDDNGDINAEVTGFVLQAPGWPTVYVSGDNASIAPVVQISKVFSSVDVAVLHAGAGRVPAKFDGRALTLTAERAADVAQLLGAPHVVAVHCEGWSLYSQGPDDVRHAFEDTGIVDRLRYAPPGTWAIRGLASLGSRAAEN